MSGRHVVAAAAAVLWAAGFRAPAAAQDPPDTTVAAPPAARSPDASGEGARPFAVSSEAWRPLVATTLVFPGGSTLDAEGRSGAATLLGATLARMAEDALPPGSGRVRVEVDRGRTTVHLLAAPAAWPEAYETLAAVLYRRELEERALEAARAELLDRLRFEAGAPVREFEEHMYAMVGGSGGEAWARSPGGSVESVQAVRPADLREVRRAVVHPAAATIGVVGPVDEAAVAGRLSSAEAEPGLPAYSRTDVPAGGAGAGPAWTAGGRTELTREVTSTWIAVAYPAPPGASRTALEFLADVLRARLNPEPADPGLYGVEVTLVDAPGGTVLLLSAAVSPDAADRWEIRILETVATPPVGGRNTTLFPWQRRRFRSHLLLSVAVPEGRALRMAADLAREGAVRGLEERIWELTPTTLQETAASLGEPRILVFGPDLVGPGS